MATTPATTHLYSDISTDPFARTRALRDLRVTIRRANQRADETGDFAPLVMLLWRAHALAGGGRDGYHAVHDLVWQCHYAYVIGRMGITSSDASAGVAA